MKLNTMSDAGLPVHFYVKAGLALVENEKLVFTKIPPRSKFPVVDWQCGRSTEPKSNPQNRSNKVF